MAPAVSFLLPAHNAAATIDRALVSLRGQTFADWEAIIVDDGSTDATSDRLAAAAAAEPRYRILHTPQKGIVAALNTALAHARAPLLARMDADDECHPERLARQVALLEADPSIGVCATQVRFGGDAVAQRGYALHVDWSNGLLSPEEIALNRFIDAPVAHPSVLFRRPVVEQHGSYRETGWPEDYELWLRWLEAGVRFAKVPAPLMVWHDPPQRLSRTDPRYTAEAFAACRCHYLARWLQREVRPDRPLFLRGAGRPTRKRFAALATHGIRLAGYVDVDSRKIGGRIDGVPVLSPEAVPPADACFVLGAVASRGAREFIRGQLRAQGRTEGRDFLIVA